MEVPTVCSQDNGTHNFCISFSKRNKTGKKLYSLVLVTLPLSHEGDEVLLLIIGTILYV